MNRINKYWQIGLWLIFLFIVSCQSNPTNKIQGVFSADKSSLKDLMEEGNDNNQLASTLLEKAIENAIIEFKIENDSINGLMSFIGNSSVLHSKIEIRNDSVIVNSKDASFYLIPNKKGILLQNRKSEIGIQLIKEKRDQISSEAKKVLKNFTQKEKEEKEFNENLGRWEKGNIVDDFGDETGKNFVYSLVKGKHDNSSITNSDVFVKTSIEKDGLLFEIYDSSMSFKENLPDRKFGTIKIKYPNGDVKTERIFFFQNIVSEAPDDKNNLIYNYLLNNNGDLKLLIDLSTASRFYTDRYQFTISSNNLNDILKEMKN